MGRQRASSAPNTNINASPPGETGARIDRRILMPNEHHHLQNVPGKAICPRCHAIWDLKRWHLDEAEYERLRQDGSVEQLVCPADVKIEREEYDGQVTLRSPLISANQDAIVGLIKNTEAHMREHNPMSRIAELKREGDTIEVLTIGSFLAERIGKELRKAYHGQLEIQHLERANFKRVVWYRE